VSADVPSRRMILEEPWSFSFWEEADGALVLEVVCGTVGMFEVRVRFSDEQRATYAREGEAFVRRLARAVNDAPDAFLPRATTRPRRP
jgi:hypothetical protein